ncbi:hypothetical protein POPTR_012G062650v4 [Populus trichocarpa]|uniref:Uncharacterized protein n=1 Tax=Populus trichocarpa TaxID=3694 RepID=A0ACC0S5I6_POPTR|nr:hypothetical protein POPTR_012G062650v4 [Populus trichocarpa]
MVKIGNEHSYQKLYFLNSRSPNFKRSIHSTSQELV